MDTDPKKTENDLDAMALEIFFALEEKERQKRGQPGQVVTRKVDGRIVPIAFLACPDHEVFAHMEEEPVCCGTEDEGTCCGELYSIGLGHVRCEALRAAPMKNEPMVALVTMQNREAPPPPHNLN